MNPQTLDPKLKAIYDRVMGMKIPPPEAKVEQHEEKPEIIDSKPKSKTMTFVSNGSKEEDKKIKSGSLGAILLTIIGILFFATYLVFWLKYFNIKLPIALPF